MPKKTISFILCLITVFLSVSLSACDTNPTSYTLRLVGTTLSASTDSTEYPYTIEWDNNAFSIPPSQFSPQLARTAMVLSASAYNNKIITANLTTLGFEKKAKFNYGKKYNENAIGVVIASKEINDTTVVAVTMRGTYQKEWYSNFRIGKDVANTQVHEGFDKAAKYIIEKIDEYMFNYGIEEENTKFVLTGHSRGAAVANLSAAYLIDEYSSDRVYAYTFATPNTTTREVAADDKYSGIFNFVNPEDFISYIPLESWGFTKYGTTITFPTAQTDTNFSDALNKVSDYYEKYTKTPLKTFNGTQKLTEFLECANTIAPTPYDYYNKKYDIAGLEMSLYDYMMTVAYVLNNKDSMTNGLILMGSDGTVFEPIKNYLLSGMDTKRSMLALDYENALIGYAHTTQTYLAWLEYYIENN